MVKQPLTHAQPNQRITWGQLLHLERGIPANLCDHQVITLLELWVILCFIAKSGKPPHGETTVDACTTKPTHHLGPTFALGERHPGESV